MLIEPPTDEARQALDRALLDALKARLDGASAAAPDAEAIALRDLLTKADAGQSALLRAVWGRLSTQTSAPLIACGPSSQLLAADRFGLAFSVVEQSDAALSEVANGSRALIDLGGSKPWWARLLARPELRIVAALPDDRYGHPRALIVSKQPCGPTGDDRTFWATDSTETDVQIVDAFGQVGLSSQPLVAAGGLKLFMLAGYVQPEDGRLATAPGDLKGVIGAAPIF